MRRFSVFRQSALFLVTYSAMLRLVTWHRENGAGGTRQLSSPVALGTEVLRIGKLEKER